MNGFCEREYKCFLHMLDIILELLQSDSHNTVDYQERKRIENKVKDIQKLKDECIQYRQTDEKEKLKVILAFYQEHIKKFAEIYEEYSPKYVANKEREIAERRVRDEKKKNIKVNINALNYHNDEKIADGEKERLEKYIIMANSDWLNMIGSRAMREIMWKHVAISWCDDKEDIPWSPQVVAELLGNTVLIYESGILQNILEPEEMDKQIRDMYARVAVHMEKIQFKTQRTYDKWENVQFSEELVDYVIGENLPDRYEEEFGYRLLAFFLELYSDWEGSYRGEDLVFLEQLKNKAKNYRTRYLLTMAEAIARKYQRYDSMINWLIIQLQGEIRQSVYTGKQDKEKLKAYMLQFLKQEIVSPSVMEAALCRTVYETEQINDLRSISPIELEAYETYGRSFSEKMNRDGFLMVAKNIYGSNSDGVHVLGNTEYYKILFKKSVSAMFGKNEKLLSGNYNLKNVLRPAEYICEESKKFNEKEKAYYVEAYIALTGYNVCITLLHGLEGICIFKDTYSDYSDALDALIEQLARYIKVFGSSTMNIVSKMFEVIKKINEEERIWKFKKNSPEQAIECIELITSVLKICNIEEEMNYYLEKYMDGIAVKKDEAESFDSVGTDLQETEGVLSDEQKLLRMDQLYRSIRRNRLNNTREEIKVIRKYKPVFNYDELKKRIDELKEGNPYCVNADIWEALVQPMLATTKETGRPTDKNGRWYCVLQKKMIDKLNNL